MTHTNHRRGTVENLSNDYIVLAMAARGYNDQGAGDKLTQILTIALKYHPVNMGNMKAGNRFMAGSFENIIGKLEGATIVQMVFTTAEDTAGFLREVKEAELGMSVVLTGIFDNTAKCVHDAGLTRHTIEHSLGIWGKTELLPDPAVLEFTTMCGHGMIAADLIYRAAKDVETGALTLDEAVTKLVKPCVCGIANPVRAKTLLAAFIKAQKPQPHPFIAMDPTKCDMCYACEQACLDAHPQNSRSVCFVEGHVGAAASLRCFHCENAPCMDACMVGCIEREASGAVVLDAARCIGCWMCIMVCPFGMITTNKEKGTAAKCDLCVELRAEGKLPACVAACPRGALSVPDSENLFAQRRREAGESVGLISRFSTPSESEFPKANSRTRNSSKRNSPKRNT